MEGFEQFNYLGSSQGPDGYCRSGMIRHTVLASTIIGLLLRLWKCSKYKPKPTDEAPSLSGASHVSFNVRRRDVDLVCSRSGEAGVVHMTCQHHLLNIHWSDHVPSKSVCELTGLSTVDDYLSLWTHCTAGCCGPYKCCITTGY